VLPRAAGVREYLDRPVPRADREASLADIARLNRWFGGYRVSERAIETLLARVPDPEPLTVIDVGGGRGDLLHRLAQRARRRGRRLRGIVVDRTPVPAAGSLTVCADATALPFRPGGAHVVSAVLLLHHLEPGAVVQSLAEMRAVARVGVVVNDLLRTRPTLVLVWLVTRLLRCHRFSRHDGPLSVRRAYSPDELRELAGQAGVAHVRVRRYPWLGRLVAILT
jgi:hypothetical protein